MFDVCAMIMNSLNPRDPTVIAASADSPDLLIINIRSGVLSKLPGESFDAYSNIVPSGFP